MAPLNVKRSMFTVLSGQFLLLLLLEVFSDMTRFSYVRGEIVLQQAVEAYNSESSLGYNKQYRYQSPRKGNVLEENEMKPVHWNPSDNVHKKKQFPRSSRRLENAPKRGRFPQNSALRAETMRSGRTSSLVDHGTLKPAGNFNALEDVERLRKILRSKLISDDDIISIMTKRTNDQRKQIIQLYPDLKREFGWKLSFGFRDLIRALATPLHDFHAEQLKEAFRFSTKPDEDLLVELLCTYNNRQLKSVQQSYRNLYRKEIQDELHAFSQNPFIRFLMSYTQGNRDERNNIDLGLATYDAQQLQSAGKLTIDNGSPFWKIVLTRSFPQLKLTFSEYKRITGRNIKETIRKDFSGNTQKGLINIVKTISNRPHYFAEILNAGIRNFSKRDATLIRITLLRAEIDLEDIKASYHKLYNIPLAASIPTNTGSLKKALLSLING